MKFRLLQSAWFLALAISVASPAWAAPKIEFQATKIELPPAKDGQKRRAEFKFKNTGDEPLSIAKVEVSCGCTAPTFTKETPPGGEGVVALELDTLGITGDYRKTARVLTDDPQNLKVTLTITGRVDPAAKVEPGRVMVLGGCVGTPAKGVVLVRSLDDKPMTLLGWESPLDDMLSADLKPLEGGKIWRVEIKAETDQPTRFGAPFALKMPGDMAVGLWVEGELQGPIAIRPGELYFGDLLKAGREPVALALYIEKACMPELNIDKLEYNQERYEVKRLPVRPGASEVLVVTPLLKNIPRGRFEDYLTIYIGEQEMEVALAGVVR